MASELFDQWTTNAYRADTLGIISALLHGYSGGITIVREMAQNADDVPGDGQRWLEFHFNDQSLVIRNNTTFRPIDFDNIKNIARGGKRSEQRNTIGMFGVGFVSVYQLTDTPILRSSGQELCFVPEHGHVLERPSQVVDVTEFDLPYRRHPTSTSDRLGMPAVTELALQEIQTALADEAYRLLFFLRRLSKISMYRNNQPICIVERQIIAAATPNDPDELIITRQHHDAVEQHRWLRYHGQVRVAAPRRPDGSPAKDAQVQIVIPDQHVPDVIWRDLIPGRLYNYLPTEIETDLPFQINGDFYPSTDRKHIDQDHANHRDWNNSVFKGLGECLAAALPSLLQHFADVPLKLYQRLPINKAASNLVKPIINCFFDAAAKLPIFYANDKWQIAAKVRWAQKELHSIAKQVDLRLMDAELQSAAWGLILRANVPEYTLRDFLKRVSIEIAAGSKLAAGPAYLQNRAQLATIYTMLEKDFARPDQAEIESTPLFIDQFDQMWPANACVWTNQAVIRQNLHASGLHFWDVPADTYPRLKAALADFELAHVWRILRTQLNKSMPLSEAPPWLNTRQKLYTLYKTIRETREHVSQHDTQGLHLCLNRTDWLCLANTLRMPHDEPIIYDLFADDPDAPLVARATWEEKPYRGLYEDFGVGVFDYELVLKRLEKVIRVESALADAHPLINSREKALRLYRYLSRHREEFQPKNIELLRHRLPLWLAHDQSFHFAEHVSLPASNNSWPEFIKIDAVLDIPTSAGLDPFFADTLELKRLDTARFITHHLLPQYATLQQSEQGLALKFLRTEIELIRSNPGLLEAIQQTALIYGDDERLYKPRELCFPRTRLRSVFPDYFHVPHQMYAAPLNAETHWVWEPLFMVLGVHRVAPANVVFDEVQRLTTGGMLPRHQRDAIEKIFRYLEEYWHFYQTTTLSKRLAERAWLPALDDQEHWYKPKDLYDITQKALVDQVAHILGFNQAIRPRKDIAEALGLHPSPSRALVVKQLLALKDANKPAADQLYAYLINATDEELKPLHHKPIIWDEQKRIYRKASHILLGNYQADFGAYRGYLTSGNSQQLLRRLGANSTPSDHDYIELIEQISTAFRMREVPQEEQRLLMNAYERLRNAEPALLEPLKQLPCILSKTGDTVPLLCLPNYAIFQPTERFMQLFPNLPIASYTPDGEELLRKLGVQAIEQVRQVEFQLQPKHTHPYPFLPEISRLNYALTRLFHHYGLLAQVEAKIAELQVIKAYLEPSIQVVYTVKLAEQTYVSKKITEPSLYKRDAQTAYIYLEQGLDQQQKTKALAQALLQVLQIPVLLVLLKELLADPQNWVQILDENNVKPLPPEIHFELPETNIEEFQLGEQYPELSANSHEALLPSTSYPMPEPQKPEPFADSRSKDVLTEPNAKASAVFNASSALTGLGLEHETLSKKAQRSTGSLSNGTKNNLIQPKNETTPVSPLKIPIPLPAINQSNKVIPPFIGRNKLSSPAIQTDIDGLKDRVRTFIEQQGLDLDTSVSPARPQLPTKRVSTKPAEPQLANVAQFTLSFSEVSQGFLRLSAKARELFLHKPAFVHCTTDFDQHFDLYFAWQRDMPIAYNQAELSGFFAEQQIPAGGIVYLELIHGDSYRLYYNQVPHSVPEVRIAISEQGVVSYEIIDEVMVHCETNEAIYRAEKRHEDQIALWLEAVGKKSIEETLCDLLLVSPDGWLHETDLKAMIGAERMVAASTVEQTLHKQPWFVSDANGFWRLDPKSLLASHNDVSQKWLNLSQKLIASDDQQLLIGLDPLLRMLHELRQRLLALESQQLKQVVAVDDQLQDLISLLNADPYNQIAEQSLLEELQHYIADETIDLLNNSTLRGWFETANQEVWRLSIRPLLNKELQILRRNDQYERAAELAQCWADFDRSHGQSIETLVSEAQAWRRINEHKTVDTIMQAIEQAPNLIKLREELHIMLQAELQRHTIDYWLQHSTPIQAVMALFAYVQVFEPARDSLAREDQKAFDRTVQLQAKQLAAQLTDSYDRMVLALSLAQTIKLPLPESHLADLVNYLKRADVGSIDTLLIGLKAWNLCQSVDYLHNDIADSLARCHSVHRIWELANNQPWKAALSAAQKKQLHQGWEQHRASQLQREELFLTQLHGYTSALGQLLNQDRLGLQTKVQRDIQNLLASSAG
ncbi:sacsin N-terminal ATP-binding-like domain-containing protein [Herpetosiphon sp. NSE202]|uniref:sacsin N-terminal ATP-binding-like domain-containing protein n=1 Tax=Herpetosiphon sp. NSE202 TaxID=3351349 RepID=UPI003624CD92